jgi:hypothetical protein
VLDPGDERRVGTLQIENNLMLGPQARLAWSIRDVNTPGGAPSRWDRVDVQATLAFEGTAELPWQFSLNSVSADGTAAPLADFSPDRQYAWEVARAADIVGFEPGSVKLELSSFLAMHPLAAAEQFSLRIGGDSLWLVYRDFPARRCDLTGDQVCDVADIDLLTIRVVHGPFDPSLDLNDDGVLDAKDRTVWVQQEMGTTFGDANLDGRFDSADLVEVFQAGRYEDGVAENANWATGDWNGDLDFGTGDLVLAFQAGAYHAAAQVAQAVPEPRAELPLVTLLVLWCSARGRATFARHRSRRTAVTFGRTGCALCTAVCVLTLWAVPGTCRETRWRRPQTEASWFESSRWTAGIPTAADIAIISRDGTAVIDQGNAAFNQMFVGYTSTLDHPPVGHLRQTGGEARGDYVFVRRDSTYELQDGSVNVRHWIELGSEGNGQLWQKAGTISTNQLGVGRSTENNGTIRHGDGRYTIDDGLLEASSLNVGDLHSRGAMEQRGGTIRLRSNLSVWSPDATRDRSVVDLLGGELSVPYITVNAGGTMRQAGGKLTADGLQVSAYTDQRDAAYEMLGGELLLRGLAVGESRPESPSGAFSMTGGRLEITNPNPGSPDDIGRFVVFAGKATQAGGALTADAILLGDNFDSDPHFDLIDGSVNTQLLRVGNYRGSSGKSGTLRLLGPGVRLTAATMTVGGTELPVLEEIGHLAIELAPAQFEVTESLEFGRRASYSAAAGTILTFRGQRLQLYSDSAEAMSGLQATELLLQPPDHQPSPLHVQLEAAGKIGGTGDLRDNFAWGTVRIPEQTNIVLQLQDTVDNQQDLDLAEALFIKDLVVEAGATLTLIGTPRVYYQTLSVHPMASIIAPEGQLLPLSAVGDFNADGTLDVLDLDLLQSAFGSSNPQLDLNIDGVVSQSDLQIWLHDSKKTWYGDANLDGLFETDDLVQIFAAGQFEDQTYDNSIWPSGDFDGDRDFTTTDLVFAFQDGGYRRGPRASVSAVPEPAGCGSVLGLLLGAAGFVRRAIGQPPAAYICLRPERASVSLDVLKFEV